MYNSTNAKIEGTFEEWKGKAKQKIAEIDESTREAANDTRRKVEDLVD